MSDIRPTEEQQEIMLAVGAKGASAPNVMVPAYAGTAKTTTLELAARGVGVPAMALAFNKKIATEMKTRMPGNFTCVTLNGLGHQAWARSPAVGGLQLKIEDKKLGKLVSQVAKDRQVNLDGDSWDQLRRLANGAMQAGIVPVAKGDGGLIEDTREHWQDTTDLDDDDFEFLYDMAREVVERNIDLAKQGVISFDDQIYMSALFGGKYPQYPMVFVDESQDLSPLNHKQLELANRADGRLVSVGDKRQAIYAFRGADGASMDRIADLKESWRNLPLTTTFRCPKRIVARQQEHAPGFTAWHTNTEGEVVRFEPIEEDESGTMGGWTWGDFVKKWPRPEASVAIICRNNAPLMSMALKLLTAGVGVHFLGRDIGKSLIAFTRKLCEADSTPADIVRGKVEEWETSESSKAIANKHEEKVAGIRDKADCIIAVLDGSGAQDAGQLRSVLTRLFARDSGLITLSSGHKSKGLEWDVVMHLDPWRIPSKWAKMAAKVGNSVPLEQEWNLNYVIETRTKHTLINANLEDFH